MTNRVNFSLILIGLILINLKIILINEETLILICFSVFCFLASSRLSSSVEDFFNSQTTAIKSELVASTSKLITITQNKQNKLQTKVIWPHIFSNLKADFKGFNFYILAQFSSFYHFELKNKLKKKLEFSARLEVQLTKVLTLIIAEKLQKFVAVQNFFEGTLKVPAFKTIKTIYFREHLQKLIK